MMKWKKRRKDKENIKERERDKDRNRSNADFRNSLRKILNSVQVRLLP